MHFKLSLVNEWQFEDLLVNQVFMYFMKDLKGLSPGASLQNDTPIGLNPHSQSVE
jgi:hypothetical protein